MTETEIKSKLIRSKFFFPVLIALGTFNSVWAWNNFLVAKLMVIWFQLGFLVIFLIIKHSLSSPNQKEEK